MSRTSKLNINPFGLICQAIGTVFLAAAVFMPNWLTNPSGLNYYPFARSWGLFYVTGRITQTNWDAWETQCRIASMQSLDVVCITPLCQWYNAKCAGYKWITVTSMVVFAMIMPLFPAMLIGVVLSMRHKRRHQSYARIITIAAAIVPVVCIAMYLGALSLAFDIINSAGYYPVPQPGPGIFVLGLAEFFMIFACISYHMRAHKILREQEFTLQAEYDVAKLQAEYDL